VDYSYPSVFWMYSIMALFVTAAVFFLVRAIRSGAVADDEAPKYRMLEDDTPQRMGDGHGHGKAK
jgi:hypothetical protein